MHVLVADDSEVMRVLTRRSVEQLGHSCETVGDGDEALERVQDEHFDVVITDWLMRHMDGDELCGNIKRLPDGDSIYCVLISATADKIRALDDMEPGADEFLLKPVASTDLERALNSAESSVA